jgi:hypothetical protein
MHNIRGVHKGCYATKNVIQINYAINGGNLRNVGSKPYLFLKLGFLAPLALQLWGEISRSLMGQVPQYWGIEGAIFKTMDFNLGEV